MSTFYQKHSAITKLKISNKFRSLNLERIPIGKPTQLNNSIPK